MWLKTGTVVFVVFTLFAVGVTVVDTATSDDMQAYVDASAEWCDERDGELYNAQVIGSHGGLHCDLPNGTTVHMHEQIDRGEIG